MKWKEIWKEEKKTVVGLFVSVLAGLILITTIWKDDFTYNVPFAVLDLDGSSLSTSIITQLKSCPTLDICYYAESEEDMKQAIRDKKVEGGVLIPPHFSHDVSTGKAPQAVVFSDCSNIITGGGSLGAASTVLGTMAAGVKMNMMEGNGIYPSKTAASLGTFSYVERTVYEPQGDYIRKMTYLLVPCIAQQTFLVTFFIPLLLRKRKEMAFQTGAELKKNIGEIFKRVILVSLGTAVATYLVLMAIAVYKNIPMRGDILLYLVSMLAFLLNVIVFGILCSSFTRRLSCFVMCYTMCSNVIIFTSGLIFPYYLMPKWVYFVTRLFSPMSALAIELKSVNLKGIGWDAAMPMLLGSLLYTAFWGIVGTFLYVRSVRREKDRPEYIADVSL